MAEQKLHQQAGKHIVTAGGTRLHRMASATGVYSTDTGLACTGSGDWIVAHTQADKDGGPLAKMAEATGKKEYLCWSSGSRQLHYGKCRGSLWMWSGRRSHRMFAETWQVQGWL